MIKNRWPQFQVYPVRVHWREEPVFYLDKCASDGRVTFIEAFHERAIAEAAKTTLEAKRDKSSPTAARKRPACA